MSPIKKKSSSFIFIISYSNIIFSQSESTLDSKMLTSILYKYFLKIRKNSVLSVLVNTKIFIQTNSFIITQLMVDDRRLLIVFSLYNSGCWQKLVRTVTLS